MKPNLTLFVHKILREQNLNPRVMNMFAVVSYTCPVDSNQKKFSNMQ